MSSKEVDGQVSMFAAQYDMSVVIMLMYDKFGERRARVAQLYRSEPSELHCDAPTAHDYRTNSSCAVHYGCLYRQSLYQITSSINMFQ